jgi:hypothetical protein
MMTLVVYQSADHTFVMHIDDEPEFVARYFGEDGIDDDEWDRIEVNGPVEVDTSRPTIVDVLETYDM